MVFSGIKWLNKDKELSSYSVYKGKLGIYNDSKDDFSPLMDVVLLYSNPLDISSLIVLTNNNNVYESLMINKSNRRIIPYEDFRNMTSEKNFVVVELDNNVYHFIHSVEEER